MARRMKLVVAYLGGAFHGWQRQPDKRTVQAELENALQTLVGGHHLKVEGAGRTDAGVHASAQVAHVDMPIAIPAGGLVRGLNNILPREVRIRSAQPVSRDFHARRNARGKLYTYRACWRESSLPWREMRSAMVMKVVDMDSLSFAAQLLPGEHDWASFTVPDQGGIPTVRKLFRVRPRPRAHGLDLDFFGEGFLRYQVRRMVGALLEVGRGRRTIDQLQSLVSLPEPGAPVWTAPARGLTLERVYYRPSQYLEFED